jgi:hypothetical protein
MTATPNNDPSSRTGDQKPMNTPDVIEQPTAPTPVACSAWLEVLRKYWNERIERKKEHAKELALAGDYALANQRSMEADATELCLKDLETESTPNAAPSHAEKNL